MTTGIANEEHRRWSIAVSADDVSEDLSEISIPDAVNNTVEALSEWGELTPKVASKDVSQLWRDPTAHPLALLFIVLDRYGNDALTWHPDVLKATLERDGVALSHSAWTKILAARVLMLSTSPWKRWTTFHWVARGLAGLSPNFTYLETPEIWHLCLAVDCMHAVDPKRSIGSDVMKFVAAVLANEGIRYAPAPIAFAQRELLEQSTACKNCGALARDDHDVRCITCGSKDLIRGGSEYDALMNATKAWMQTHRHGRLEEQNPTDPAGHCALRLLVELAQVTERRRALSSQLRTVGKR